MSDPPLLSSPSTQDTEVNYSVCNKEDNLKSNIVVCCTSDAQCATGESCQNNYCKKKVYANDIILVFRNQGNTTILLGANGPTPVYPISHPLPDDPWHLPPGTEIHIQVPEIWRQTELAAQCNEGVTGPRFWARTGCSVGQVEWVVFTPSPVVKPQYIFGVGAPSVVQMTPPIGLNGFILGTKYIDTSTGEIWYKSYGNVWVLTSSKYTVSSTQPSINDGVLGDVHLQSNCSSESVMWLKTRRVQCTTGDCSNQYDCSYNATAGEAGTSLAEFCFTCGDLRSYYDVSIVDGYNLSIDIQPEDCGNGPCIPSGDQSFDNQTNICTHGQDLRNLGPSYEGKPVEKFFLHANEVPSAYLDGSELDKAVITVFSNCGYYEYPTAPSITCDPSKDEKCRLWRKFCCQSNGYGQTCQVDSDCPDGAACWKNDPLDQSKGICACRAFFTCPPPPAPTPPSDLTSTVVESNDILWKYSLICCPEETCFQSRGYPAQPIQKYCDIDNGECLGDNTMNTVCGKAYTWPNSPATFNTDAKRFIITFSPGGTVYPTRDVMSIPYCDQLDPNIYKNTSTQGGCSPNIPGGTTSYACALKEQGSWPCIGTNVGASCQGVGTLCIVRPQSNF